MLQAPGRGARRAGSGCAGWLGWLLSSGADAGGALGCCLMPRVPEPAAAVDVRRVVDVRRPTADRGLACPGSTNLQLTKMSVTEHIRLMLGPAQRLNSAQTENDSRPMESPASGVSAGEDTAAHALQALPDDVLLHILVQLPAFDLASLKATCSFFATHVPLVGNPHQVSQCFCERPVSLSGLLRLLGLSLSASLSFAARLVNAAEPACQAR